MCLAKLPCRSCPSVSDRTDGNVEPFVFQKSKSPGGEKRRSGRGRTGHLFKFLISVFCLKFIDNSIYSPLCKRSTDRSFLLHLKIYFLSQSKKAGIYSSMYTGCGIFAASVLCGRRLALSVGQQQAPVRAISQSLLQQAEGFTATKKSAVYTKTGDKGSSSVSDRPPCHHPTFGSRG